MSADDVKRKVGETPQFEPERPPLPFAVVPVADLAKAPPAAPSFWWGGYLPAGVVTLLSAHGGTGKTMIGLMLGVSIALGLPLFGIGTRRGIVAVYSAEDGADLLRYRLRWICDALGIDPAALDGRLHILDATAGDPVLFHEVTEGGRRYGATTATFEALTEYVGRHRIDVLIADNASDTFDASEIDRSRVRGFMRALARIAQARHGAVLLLAHVAKVTSRGPINDAEGYSGSTAWHNSARSRLYLSRDRDGSLLLEHQKANLGAMREPLRLLWPSGGIPTLDVPVNAFVAHIAERADELSLVKLLHEFYGHGEYVATETRSRYHVAKVLGGEPTYPKRRKPTEVFGMLRDMERRGWIEREMYRDHNRKAHERWSVTPAGLTAAGIAPSAPCAPSTEDSAPGHPAQQGAPSAPCSAQGVWGNGARAQVGAEAEASP
jgi:hypothetical protein